MASSEASNYDEIWKLLERFNFEIDPKLSIHIACLICQKILTDAYQGPCGCNYCKKCIKDYLETEKFCPGLSNDCKSEKLSFERNLIKDNGTNRKISQLKLKCPLNKCDYENELRDLVKHIKTCKFLQKYCPFEELGCQVGELDDEGISEHLRSQSIGEEYLKESLNYTTNQIKNIKQFYEGEISKLNEKCYFLEKELSELKNPFVDKLNLSNSDKQDRTTSFQWIVCNLSQKRKINHHVMSGYFYTNRKDYEIRLRLCLLDHHKPCSGDMSLKLYIHNGKSDVKNIWPFKGNISIAMINKAYLKANLELSRYCEIPQPISGYDSTEVFEFPLLDLQRLKILESDSVIIECKVTLM